MRMMFMLLKMKLMMIMLLYPPNPPVDNCDGGGHDVEEIDGELNPIHPAHFGPFNTQGGQICPQLFSLFPDLLEGVTCSKMGLQLSSRKNLQCKTHFWCLGH